jgi:hypothetical protein
VVKGKRSHDRGDIAAQQHQRFRLTIDAPADESIGCVLGRDGLD